MTSDVRTSAERRSVVLRRITDQVTVVVLLAAVVLVAVVGAPALVRGLTPEAKVARRGIERAMRERGWAVASIRDDAPPAGFEGLADPDPAERPRVPATHPAIPPVSPGDPLGPPPGIPRAPSPSDPLVDDDDSRPLAVATEATPLRAAPNVQASTVGAVRQGDALVIAKESGSWLLVIRSSRDGEAMGWLERAKVKVP